MKIRFRSILIALIACVLAGCGAFPVALRPDPTAPVVPLSTPTELPAATSTATPPLPTATPTPTHTPTPIPTPTVTPYPLLPTPTLAPLTASMRQEIFNDVWTLVRDRYVYEDYGGVDWDAVREEFEPLIARAASEEEFYALIEQMVARLGDDHTRFDTPQEVAEEAARFDGGGSICWHWRDDPRTARGYSDHPPCP
jgi:carboxyl-terminal processing protease